MFEAEVNSGFTNGGDINISNRFTEITLLHPSSNGYTEVYKAKRFGQWCVLKCLTKKASKEIQYQTLIEKEFRIAYPLSHPNIIRTLGLEEVPGLGTCVIQEYIEGELVETINREQAIGLCDAVSYLHQNGVIHRDIKPENILIRKDNQQAVLIDFGLADKADFSVLKGGAGTTGFAAPEQWKGDLSPLVDIYGIGSVLLENKQFKRIAAKCRQDNPQKRYCSAAGVKKALQFRFPWLGLCIGAAIIILTTWSVYNHVQSKQNTISSKEEIASLKATNDAFIETIDSLGNLNHQLEQDLNNLNEDYKSYRREAEETQHSLENALKSEHNANMRLRQDVAPLYNQPNRNNSAENQRY